MDYKIKFSDLYYEGWVPGILEGSAPHQISGRLMLWLDTLGNIYSIRAISDDYAIEQMISNLPCELEDFLTIFLELNRDGHIAELDELVFITTGYSFPPLQGNFIHLTLDQEWYALLYEGNSNKVLRTLATGQSDITRHEAYTKVTGLNESNSIAPKYTNNTNSHEYVDLGLPSGTLWATMNVGANSPEDPGLLFAWGEVEPRTQDIALWDYYKWYNIGMDEIKKYNSVDHKDTLELEDDAAHVYWGGEWHMPTKEQVEELLENTEYIQEETGEYLESKINGNRIRIVEADARMGTVYFWTSSVGDDFNSYCMDYYGDTDIISINKTNVYGVRPVIGNILK